jgi:S1-C subfamily serine protease
MMKYLHIAISVFLILVGHAWADTGETDLTRLFKRVSPSVVTVVTYNLDNQISGFGSGFFINAKGHLITNYHVLEGAFRADIKTIEGEFYPIAAVIGQNERADIVKTVVQIPLDKIRWIEPADHDPAIAEHIITLGSPMGLEQTVSEGIISAVRTLPARGRFFQMSAPISRGSSGGPVINMAGRAIDIAMDPGRSRRPSTHGGTVVPQRIRFYH